MPNTTVETTNRSLSYFPWQTNLRPSNSLATKIVLILGCQYIGVCTTDLETGPYHSCYFQFASFLRPILSFISSFLLLYVCPSCLSFFKGCCWHIVAFVDHYTHFYEIVKHHLSYIQLCNTQHAYNLLQNTRFLPFNVYTISLFQI